MSSSWKKKKKKNDLTLLQKLQRSGAAREEEGGAVTFDSMLDHQGICCSDCQRSYTHCQRICQPLRGHWPWPYHYRGCQVACRVIMPCRWWVARILGVVWGETRHICEGTHCFLFSSRRWKKYLCILGFDAVIYFPALTANTVRAPPVTWMYDYLSPNPGCTTHFTHRCYI